MNFLLDTCVVSDFFKKYPPVVARLQQCRPSQIAISSITVMEVEYGLCLNPQRAMNLRSLWDAFVDHTSIHTFGYQEAEHTAIIRAVLKEQGLPIGPYDIMLAGTALANNLIFVTSNSREFARVPGLAVEDWRAS